MGNSYEGLCRLINAATKGSDGIYFTYTEATPIAFNPFYSGDKVYGIEKRDSLVAMILSLWLRGVRETPGENVSVSTAVDGYLLRVHSGDVSPSFNTFYEYVRDVFSCQDLREKEFDIINFLHVLKPFYKGGQYDYLLNSEEELDLLNRRFIIFEIDRIRDNEVLFQVVTLVLMETVINKMRRVTDARKVLVLEEAWQAIAREGMAQYIQYLYKTIRKYNGEVIVVSQEVDDIISSPVVKEAIIMNADTKILLDQKKNRNKFDKLRQVLGLTDREKAQILSINASPDSKRDYRELWIGLGGRQSAVYATETSREEKLAYLTEQEVKARIAALASELGDYEAAIGKIASEM
jgi:conjugation system TraG family ATPase